MTNEFKFIPIIILSFFSKNTAQNSLTIQGVIVDTLNKPLPYANVYAQENESSPIIAYSISDEKGAFILKLIRPKTFLVKATMVW